MLERISVSVLHAPCRTAALTEQLAPAVAAPRFLRAKHAMLRSLTPRADLVYDGESQWCGQIMHRDVNRWLVGFVVLLAGMASGAAPTPAVPPTSRAGEGLPACEPLGSLRSPLDYRAGVSTLHGPLEIVNVNHYDPAIERIRRSEYSRAVMADLNFTLLHWPNHLPALEALIHYGLAGGKAYEYEPVYCYLERARAWVPDDPGVLLLEGYYFWKKKDNARAIEAYQAALAVDPKSVDAHYDLGLLYCDTGEYDKAVVHAHAAYEAGYPLPGLKRKLQQAGHWTE